MGTRLFVGSLPYDVTDQQLSQLFTQAGEVVSSTVISDRYSGQSKGFGFVEMANAEGAQKAIQTLNGYNLNGRPIVVNEARPKEDRGAGGGGNRGGGGGGFRDNDRRGGGGGGFSRTKRW